MWGTTPLDKPALGLDLVIDSTGGYAGLSLWRWRGWVTWDWPRKP